MAAGRGAAWQRSSWLSCFSPPWRRETPEIFALAGWVTSKAKEAIAKCQASRGFQLSPRISAQGGGESQESSSRAHELDLGYEVFSTVDTLMWVVPLVQRCKFWGFGKAAPLPNMLEASGSYLMKGCVVKHLKQKEVLLTVAKPQSPRLTAMRSRETRSGSGNTGVALTSVTKKPLNSERQLQRLISAQGWTVGVA